MADAFIRQALTEHLAAIDPALPTIVENGKPPAGFNEAAPHQKAFMMPAENITRGLQLKRTIHKGIFQVNLCYPSGIGTRDAEERAAALQTHFCAGRVLVAGGVKVRVTAKPSVAKAISLTPYTVPVSIRYESFN